MSRLSALAWRLRSASVQSRLAEWSSGASEHLRPSLCGGIRTTTLTGRCSLASTLLSWCRAQAALTVLRRPLCGASCEYSCLSPQSRPERPTVRVESTASVCLTTRIFTDRQHWIIATTTRRDSTVNRRTVHLTPGIPLIISYQFVSGT